MKTFVINTSDPAGTITRALAVKNWNQKQLAEHCGCTSANISQAKSNLTKHIIERLKELGGKMEGTAVASSSPEPESKLINIEKLELDHRIQARVELNEETIKDYAEAAEESWHFPAIVVIDDGNDLFLVDGWHRVAAARMTDQTEIPTIIKPGTFQDAIEAAAGANATHGLRRSNDDKRKAVRMMLENGWADWSDSEIARHCHVSQPFVGKVRKEMEFEDQQQGLELSSTQNIIGETKSEDADAPEQVEEDKSANNVKQVKETPQINTVRRTKNGRMMNTAGISKANNKKAKPAPTPEKQAGEALVKFTEYCADVRKVELNESECHTVAQAAWATINHFLPKLRETERKNLIDKIGKVINPQTEKGVIS